MTRCLCVNNNGKQCTRDASNKPAQNKQFCWQHQSCKKIFTPQKETIHTFQKKDTILTPLKETIRTPQKKESKNINRGQIAYDYLSKNSSYFKTDQNDRTKLRDDIEKYWVGKKDSNIGVGGPISIDWRTRKISAEGFFFRKDIYLIRIYLKKSTDHYSIFVEPDLSYEIDKYDVTDKSLFENAKKYIKDYINYYLKNTDSRYIKRQQKWFKEEPWEYIDDKTPEEAVEILKSLGW